MKAYPALMIISGLTWLVVLGWTFVLTLPFQTDIPLGRVLSVITLSSSVLELDRLRWLSPRTSSVLLLREFKDELEFFT